jgi:hypothetical protein
MGAMFAMPTAPSLVFSPERLGTTFPAAGASWYVAGKTIDGDEQIASKETKHRTVLVTHLLKTVYERVLAA